MELDLVTLGIGLLIGSFGGIGIVFLTDALRAVRLRRRAQQRAPGNPARAIAPTQVASLTKAGQWLDPPPGAVELLGDYPYEVWWGGDRLYFGFDEKEALRVRKRARAERKQADLWVEGQPRH